MNRKEAILGLQEVLVRRRDALRESLTGCLDGLREPRTHSQNSDVVDEAMDSLRDDVDSLSAEAKSRELECIGVALERIRQGKHGVCEGCQTQIPMTRLNALPHTTLCVKCQREAEREDNQLALATTMLADHSAD